MARKVFHSFDFKRDSWRVSQVRQMGVIEGQQVLSGNDWEELERIVDDAIAETGATSIRDLGRVMADVMPQVSGRADGSDVSRLVREKLA